MICPNCRGHKRICVDDYLNIDVGCPTCGATGEVESDVDKLRKVVLEYFAALDAWASTGRGTNEVLLDRAEIALRAAVGAPPGMVSAGNCVKP